uniref:Isoform E of Serine-arginine protein kinase at 79D n=1 Tax=Drosophila melanogaster TaxID=7227 RepID=M9MS50-2|nr:Serine-arginine protein kinase at 79D, isoform E [Drosophila melanogaster]NP_001262209.1 Serine-arginine protein kinase at 79D, isoform N [Drosophila melanogaster]ADV37596.1 Serine-arginine protein kinase at 79D, isoform E [Drosophila melanogaster]AGB94902.1 Serine-arginine protein kinase at 79D, isoform N [Drosophila melanogaster]|eukprot:NP_001189160.1 Serine-arginine protein kinase at 79D, isoform E [Drosophila melanogaster]
MDDFGSTASDLEEATCPMQANATFSIDWRVTLLDHWLDLYLGYMNRLHMLLSLAGRLHLLSRHILGTLGQDPIFMGVLQGSLLMLFLFLMHLLRLWSCGYAVERPLNPTPDVAKELSCDFNFVSEQEKRAAQEAATEALLEVEEKKRRKRFTKKRNCVSAGPILIALRHQSKRPKHHRHAALPFEPVTPGEIILDTYLPPRELPLTIRLPQLAEPVKEEEVEYIELKSEPRGTLSTTDEIYPDSSDSSLYVSDEEQEDASQYCRGGYHPVVIGDIFDNRFRVVRKLGWGHFSTVWLCRDLKDEKYVALKVVKSAPHYIETAADEIRLLEAIRDADPMDVKRERIVRLMNHFTVRGVNGMHTCLVFEALGCSLYKLIVKNNYQGLAIAQVRNIIRQVLEGLDYLHSKCSIIHTDIKPENILLVIDNAAAMNQQIDDEINSLRVKGVDFPDSYISSIEKQTKSRAKWPLIEPNGSTNTNTNTSNSTATNSNSSTPLAAVIMSTLDKEDTTTTTSSTLNSNTTSSLASKYSSLLGDSECNGGLGGSANINNRYRTEKKITAKSSGDCDEDAESDTLGEQSTLASTMDSPTDLDPEPELDSKPNTVPEPSEGPIPENQSQSSQNNTYTIQSLIDNSNVRVKIADLGNACYDYHHFTEDIQTRQYRSIEVLLGAPYNYTADIWSTACLAFELATGDYLFDPHAGESYSRDEDHLAHIVELLGSIPQSVIFRGKHGLKYFTSYGSLRNITKLKPWSLMNVLVEKYDWDPVEAKKFSDFLLPMLEYNPVIRASAAECLQHPWLEQEEFV